MLRSEKVQECVRKYTEEMLYDGRIDAEGIDASTVSLMTKIGRTNVSKELNSLWKNGQLIKLQGRPVFFLDYLTLILGFRKLFHICSPTIHSLRSSNPAFPSAVLQ